MEAQSNIIAVAQEGISAEETTKNIIAGYDSQATKPAAELIDKETYVPPEPKPTAS